MDRAAIVDAFQASFGQPPEVVAMAPGRINLIGEHTDYNDGFVFPAAIDRGLHVAASRTEGATELDSIQVGPADPFDARRVAPGAQNDWGVYAAGMAWVLRDRGDIPNVRALVHSEVPIGAGISSSAAIELAFGLVFANLAGIALENKELALLGQRAENEFVGMKCGIMDQMASAMGREGCALFLDTRSLDILYAPIPPDLAIVLCDTMTPRALTDSAYNERRSQCEAAAKALDAPALRDADILRLEERRADMPEVVYRRARHVITENARCELFLEALRFHDRERLGDLMRASHESLRDDYEVSSPELDQMADACAAAPGYVGARMTGAGFGGACVALVEADRVDEFRDRANRAYQEASNRTGELTVCRAVQGAHLIPR